MNICGETFQEEQTTPAKYNFKKKLFASYQESELLVKRKTTRNPRRRMKKMATEMDGSLTRIMKGDWEKKYTISNCQSCSKGPRNKIYWQRDGNVRGNLVTNSFFLVEEMFFIVLTIVSCQNNKVYATSPDNISEGIRIHFIWQKPSGIMIRAVVIPVGSKGVEMNSRV